MKYILFTIFCFSTYIGYGQTSSKISQANIELAAQKTGVLLKRLSKKVGSFQGMDFYKMDVEDVATKTRYSGLRVEYADGGERGTVFIDSDELKTLTKSVELMRDKRLDPIPGIDYKFMCRGGFDLEFGWSDKQWGVFMTVGNGIKKKRVFFYEIADIFKLITILNDANS